MAFPSSLQLIAIGQRQSSQEAPCFQDWRPTFLGGRNSGGISHWVTVTINEGKIPVKGSVFFSRDLQDSCGRILPHADPWFLVENSLCWVWLSSKVWPYWPPISVISTSTATVLQNQLTLPCHKKGCFSLITPVSQTLRAHQSFSYNSPWTEVCQLILLLPVWSSVMACYHRSRSMCNN